MYVFILYTSIAFIAFVVTCFDTSIATQVKLSECWPAMMKLAVVLTIAGCCQVISVQCMLQPLNETVVFKQGELGYFCFRIPVLHLTSKNTLLAFAEGRNTSGCGDHGAVHIVLKRSMDYGKTWFPLSVVHTEHDHTIGDLSVVRCMQCSMGAECHSVPQAS